MYGTVTHPHCRILHNHSFLIAIPSPNHSQGLVIYSPATESHLLQWLATFLQYLFTGLWVLPVFWISKPINVIWFQVIISFISLLNCLMYIQKPVGFLLPLCEMWCFKLYVGYSFCSSEWESETQENQVSQLSSATCYWFGNVVCCFIGGPSSSPVVSQWARASADSSLTSCSPSSSNSSSYSRLYTIATRITECMVPERHCIGVNVAATF